MTINRVAMWYDIEFDGTKAILPLSLQKSFEPLMRDRAFVATANLDCAISIYPIDEWDNILVGLQRLPILTMEIRRIQRLVLGYAFSFQQSNIGEIEVTLNLKKFAGIRKRAVALAFENKIEIWNPEALHSHIKMIKTLDRKNFIALLRGTVEDVNPTLLDRFYPTAVITKPPENLEDMSKVNR